MDGYKRVCEAARALPEDKLAELHAVAVALGDRGPHIVTATGRRWFMLAPKPEDVCVEDVANGLARIPRWGGQQRSDIDPVSVAQHSVLVARLLREWGAPALVQLEGLVHDAHEAYPPGDVPSPVKRCGAMSAGLIAMEQLAVAAVRRHFGVPVEMTSVVVEADATMLATERRDLVALNDCDWPAMPEPVGGRIEAWPWRRARDEWLQELARLMVEVGR